MATVVLVVVTGGGGSLGRLRTFSRTELPDQEPVTAYSFVPSGLKASPRSRTVSSGDQRSCRRIDVAGSPRRNTSTSLPDEASRPPAIRPPAADVASIALG